MAVGAGSECLVTLMYHETSLVHYTLNNLKRVPAGQEDEGPCNYHIFRPVAAGEVLASRRWNTRCTVLIPGKEKNYCEFTWMKFKGLLLTFGDSGKRPGSYGNKQHIQQGRCNEGFNAGPIAFAFWILGLGENLGFGRKFWVWAKILGLGENFRFGKIFWVRAKILCSGENFGFGQKF